MLMVRTFRGLKPLPKALVSFVAAAMTVGVTWFLWFTVSPLFFSVTVSEPLMAGAAEETSAESVSVLLEGSFMGADAFHRVSGTARVVDRGGDTVVRLEDDFRSINGPDLHVWLVRGEDFGGDYLDLGPLRGNVGAQNYVVPKGTDWSQYDRVIIWCVPFRQLFGSAFLSTA